MARYLLAALAFLGSCSSAWAQSGILAPDILRHYQVLPRYSFVQQSGDELDRDILWRARGSYDFERRYHGYDPTSDPASLFSASFDNSEIWGTIVSPGPVIALALDVDQKFNLDELKGTLLPTLRPYGDLYHFTGFAEEDLAVDLYALQQGPWMYLKGTSYKTTDFGPYEEFNLRAVARTRPWADLNGDSKVNLADYVMLRNQMGSDTATLALGDAEGVTYADWKEQFGETIPSMDDFDASITSAIASMGVSAVAVPEPASIVLLLAGAVGALLRRRQSG